MSDAQVEDTRPVAIQLGPDALNGAQRGRKRSRRKWIKRQIYYWFGSNARSVIDFLIACESIAKIRPSYLRIVADQEKMKAINARLLSDQDKIKAINAWLSTEQKMIKATNAQLSTEQKMIKATNAQLLADQGMIKGHNDYLLREHEWLKSRNEKLLAEHDRISNGLASQVVETRPAKMKMAPGMMSNFDIEAVTGLARQVPAGGTVVDVGSLLGLSASLWCIHSEAGRIVCVDPWKYEPWMESFSQANGPITKEAFLANVPDERIETIQGYSPECGKDWTAPIDLYWEDGDHVNPGCGESIRFWSSFVKPGGIACGHDCHLPDVMAEAEALATRWGSKLNILGTVWWVRNGPEA